MKSKKILSGLLAAALAFGTMAALPTIFADIAVTASAASKTTSDGFVLDVDDNGKTYVSGYEGKGGDITIPAEAVYVGREAFAKNQNIKSVIIPATCRNNIGEHAFEYSSVEKVVFEGDIESVGGWAFYGCEKLKEVTFKGDVYKDDENYHGAIFRSAFGECSNLEKVTFTDKKAKVGGIDSFAFSNCVKLSEINLPDGLIELQYAAFVNCFELKTLIVPAKTKFYYEGDIGYQFGYEYDENEETFIKMDGKTKVTVYTYKDGKEIADEYTSDGVPVMYVTKGSDAEAYCKDYGVKYKYVSSSSSGKLAAPTGFKAKKTANFVTLSWSAVDGADAYRVYLYNSETGKYEKYKTVAGTKCTVKGLSSGTKYKFKVVAVEKVDGKYKAGNSSKAVSVTTK